MHIFRDLNKQLERDNYRVPDIKLYLRTIKDGKYITNLDMSESFHQIKLSEDSITYTCFITTLGRFYEYLYVPYSTSFSSSAFQRAIDLALMGMKYVEIVFDDLVIPGKTFEAHCIRLDEALEKLNNFSFTLRGKNTCLQWIILNF